MRELDIRNERFMGVLRVLAQGDASTSDIRKQNPDISVPEVIQRLRKILGTEAIINTSTFKQQGAIYRLTNTERGIEFIGKQPKTSRKIPVSPDTPAQNHTFPREYFDALVPTEKNAICLLAGSSPYVPANPHEKSVFETMIRNRSYPPGMEIVKVGTGFTVRKKW